MTDEVQYPRPVDPKDEEIKDIFEYLSRKYLKSINQKDHNDQRPDDKTSH